MGKTVSERLAAATAKIEGLEIERAKSDTFMANLRSQARDYREQIIVLGKEAVDLRSRLADAEIRAAKAEGYVEALLDRLHPPKPIINFNPVGGQRW